MFLMYISTKGYLCFALTENYYKWQGKKERAIFFLPKRRDGQRKCCIEEIFKIGKYDN
jgi:hypothetical protein